MTEEIKRAMNIFAWTIKLNELAKGEFYNCYFSGFQKDFTFSHYKMMGTMIDPDSEWRVNCKLTDTRAMKKIEDYIKNEIKRLGGNEK